MKVSLYIQLLLAHVFIGVGVYLFKPLSKVYFVVFILFFLYKILLSKKEKAHVYILCCCSYIIGSEVFLRMTGGNFLYELSKYSVILFCIVGFFLSGINKRSLVYFFYIFLLIPGIYVGLANAGFDSNIKKNIAFNLSGPITLGVASVFCFGKKVTYSQMATVLLSLLLPVVSTAIYLFLYTPDLRDVITGTYSNFQASGGFGPNQVATVLGLGTFVLVTRFFAYSNSILLLGINAGLIILLLYRAIVTFSRGGVITGIVISVAFILLYLKFSNKKVRAKTIRMLSIMIGVLFLTWLISSIQTMGYIDKRYANEDGAGRKKEDISTGRSRLILFELNQFMENPFLGVGVGKVKELRQEKSGLTAASHNEVSRILAEHGLIGVLAFLILLVAPLTHRISNKKNVYFYSCYLFWFLTINHSAMRIAAPAFIYALSLLNITYDKPIVHRQQAVKQQ